MAISVSTEVEGADLAREAREEASTADLVRELLDESRALLLTEVALVRDETQRELSAFKRAAVALGVTGLLAMQAMTLLLVALSIACPHAVLATALLGVALLLGAGGAFFYGYRKLPRRPLGEARDRLATDIKVLKEQVV